eukprot:2316048-Rhodomonas_salina.2
MQLAGGTSTTPTPGLSPKLQPPAYMPLLHVFMDLRPDPLGHAGEEAEDDSVEASGRDSKVHALWILVKDKVPLPHPPSPPLIPPSQTPSLAFLPPVLPLPPNTQLSGLRTFLSAAQHCDRPALVHAYVRAENRILKPCSDLKPEPPNSLVDPKIDPQPLLRTRSSRWRQRWRALRSEKMTRREKEEADGGGEAARKWLWVSRGSGGWCYGSGAPGSEQAKGIP